MGTKPEASKPSPPLSRKERAPEIGHALDRLYEDRRLRGEPGCDGHRKICLRCGAILEAKHWYLNPTRFESLVREQDVERGLCPGCHRLESEIHEGEVILESPLLSASKEEVVALLHHTEDEAWHDNPASRIAVLKDLGNRLEIRTTTRWLATRLGKEMQKSFKGALRIKPSPREKFVRVYWSHA